MKVKFTKLAALLLAGVALFATGCTDYEVDIQKVDKKVDNLTSDVNGKISSLEQQIAGINATIATLETQAKHDEDIQKLNQTISALETALKADYEQKINAAVAALNGSLAELTTQMNTELDKKLDKTTFDAAKQQLLEALAAANEKIQALETADENFKTQIANLTTQFTTALNGLDAKITALDEKKADKTALAEAKTELENAISNLKTDLEGKIALLESTINGELVTLKERMDAAEAAIKKINEETIPALQAQVDKIEKVTIPAMQQDIKDLQDGKLDKATFEEYKTATAATIQLMQEAINNLIDTKVDKTVFEEKVAEIMAKFDDYVLKSYFETVVATLATKKEVQELETRINGQLDDLKKYVDEQDGKLKDYTDEEIGKLKTYVDDLIDKLQKQLDAITNDEGTGRLDVLEVAEAKLEDCVYNTILPQVKFALNYEGGLQGYIDDGDAWALTEAKKYTDSMIKLLREYVDDCLDEIWEEIYYIEGDIEDLYDRVNLALSRIQSIQFVPDYDDLKITSNMTIVTSTVEALDEDGEPTGQTEKVFTAMDQPTEVTYQFLPAQYAQDVADGIEYFVTSPAYTRLMLAFFYGYESEDMEAAFTREELKNEKIGGILPFFNVKPVDTRADADDDDPKPEFIITGVKSVDTTTGEITFEIMPKDIASADFAANGLKPQKDVELRWNGIPGVLQGLPVWGTNHQDGGRGYFGYGEDFTWSVPVWKYEDLVKFENRTAFAAQLRLYNLQYADVDWDEFDWDAFEEDEDYEIPWIDYENELASPYNVLYPGVTNVEILGEPYKPTYDEDGKPVVDGDGYAVLEPAMEEHQQLPYSSLRDNPAGEKKTQDPKGYRVILDESIPAVIINGGEPMTFEDAAEKYGIILPEYSIEFKEFTYTNEENAEKPLYIGTEKVYAEVEMNGDFSAAERMVAIGDFITGFYTYNVGLGSFEGWGDVEITPALGEVAVDAVIPWTWAYDAIVDHNLFYPDEQVADDEGNNPTLYTRVKFPININAEDAKYLEDNLAITLESFSHKEPTSFEVTVTEVVKDPDTGAESEVEVDPAPSMTIDGVTIEDGELFANFTFEQAGWDKTYNIVAVYDLGDAIITVTGTLVTIDRNREKVVLGPYEHTFIVNGEEYYDGYYHWSSEAMHKDIFEAFDAEGVINLPENTEGDFEFDADQDDFNEGELTGFLRMADPSGTAKGYVDFNRNDIVLNTLPTLTPEVLAGELFNSGERSADDPNLWLGNIVTRNVTTFIGEEVEMQMKFNYKVPDYNFLHLRFYTWNTEKEHDGFITLRNFDDNDGSVLWWSQVYPSYFNDVPAQGAAPTQEGRVSNRYALADYDVEYINLAELAFNVVDDKDKIIDDQDLAALGLTPKFVYTDKEQNSVELPEVDQFDPDYLIYEDLWKSATVFYYRTNEKKFIPALGELTLTVGTPGENGDGGFEFPVATRFEFPKASVDYPEEILDYSTYAMVRWTPFKAPVAKDVTIVLDENKIYREPLFKGMTLMDNRPNNVSFYVIKEGEWVVGNAAANATAASKKNGYLTDVVSKDAYHITTDFVYDTTGIPADLKKLLTIEVENGTPYVVYDYTSQVEFYGVVTMPVVVKLENPWQETLNFSYNIIIKGVNN